MNHIEPAALAHLATRSPADAAQTEPVARLVVQHVASTERLGELWYVEVACPHGQNGSFWGDNDPTYSLLHYVELVLESWRRRATELDDPCDTARIRDYVAQLRW